MLELTKVIENLKNEVKEILLEYVNQEELNIAITDDVVSSVLGDCLRRDTVPSYNTRDDIIYSLDYLYHHQILTN